MTSKLRFVVETTGPTPIVERGPTHPPKPRSFRNSTYFPLPRQMLSAYQEGEGAKRLCHAGDMGIVADAQASAEWIASALTSSGYIADFSPESIWEIERFFDEQSVPGSPEGRAPIERPRLSPVLRRELRR